MTRLRPWVALLVVASALGCGGVSEGADHVGSSTEALHGVGTIYAWYYPEYRMVTVHSCPIEDTPEQLANEAAGGPEDMPCDDGTTNILATQVKVLDARGRVVDVIHADRPGGGCIHVQVPTAINGGSLAIHTVVNKIPGTGRAADVFDLTVAVP